MTTTEGNGRVDPVQSILDGALEMFSRHGFEKTGMSDIAAAAGLSRTSLYKRFATKEEVFKALSQRINEGVLGDVKAAASAPGTPAEKLAGVIHARVGWVYDLFNRSEYGRELVNEKNRLCGGDVLDANDRFTAFVADLIASLPRHDPVLAPEAAARLLVASVNGVLADATTRQEAEARVTALAGVFSRGL
ncbi:MAG: helix-turn-helix domain-containing protein [Caulobacter sp.]|nr:helix-turn-helix domain-containing protein [Caulobacter sp.]